MDDLNSEETILSIPALESQNSQNSSSSKGPGPTGIYDCSKSRVVITGQSFEARNLKNGI